MSHKKIEEMKNKIMNSDLIGPNSKKELLKYLDLESFGGVLFSKFEFPPVLVKGKGTLVYDVDGKEYLDMLSGFSSLNVGHCHPKIQEAISSQSKELIHYFDFPNPKRLELAKRIADNTPGSFPKKVWFCLSGSDVVEAAVRTARWVTGKPFILSFYGAYHGQTTSTIGFTGKGGMWRYYNPVPPADHCIARFPYGYCYRCFYGTTYPECNMQCIKSIDDLLSSAETPMTNPFGNINNVAAILVEPMQSSSGYIVPPVEFLQKLRDLAQKFGVLLIVDEIQTGMGRTGKMWGCHHSDVEPDIICAGKGMGGGLPIGAVVARSELLEKFEPGSHVSTFAGYSLGCAASLAVFDIIEEEDLCSNSEVVGNYFVSRLTELKDKHTLIGDISYKGLYIGIEFVKDRNSKEPAMAETIFMNQECVNEGLLLQRGGYYQNRFQFIPALTLSKEEVDWAIEILDRVLTKAEEKF